ncbi:MAG: heme-binding protein, partial [Verrucomicrobia bacterium]|nr:heme-binding protein [Verrucomicrobiota bacterium]
MPRTLLLALFAFLPLNAQLVPSNLDKRITIPEGLTLNRFADKNQVQNATAICIDAQNRVYIAETNRWRVQVQDIRHGGRFLRDRVNGDISNMTLDDRTAFHKKWSGKQNDFLKWEEFTKDSEVIKLLEDTDGDGVSDKTTIYRGDFNAPLAGPSGGLIEKDGTVYFAMIPGVYSLKDTNNDGKAEEVKTLVNGFGVRVSFSGHDLNGFAWGPDGKLYWSIGDRGYHVEQDGKAFARPDSGGVFRANPDGSEFEEFYINLRNPKEIVFDEFG